MSSDGARLITAASDGDKKLVKKFLKDGVDVNARYFLFCLFKNFSLIVYSVSMVTYAGYSLASVLMIALDVFWSRDWDNLTAVIAAASAGHLDMVKFLIDSGADINAKDKVSFEFFVWVGPQSGITYGLHMVYLYARLG